MTIVDGSAMATRWLIVLVCLILVPAVSGFESVQFWKDSAKKDISKAWDKVFIHKVAKSLVLMVGDGMGLPTVTAGRIYKGQKLGQTGEEYKLVFEDFPNVALSKTYNLDRQVSDSAGTAAAMVTGAKVNMGTLGVTGDVPFAENCSQFREDRKLKTVLDYALESGKSVGVVTTTRITHATPGSTYAHTPWRDWEDDGTMKGISGCGLVKDIAYQLVMDNPNITVAMGGGRRAFMNSTLPGGQRIDGLDLREKWKQGKAAAGQRYAYVESKADFDKVNPDSIDYLLGLFTLSHMTYELERNKSAEPSLTEMVDKALRILKKNPKGYFLFVEGGRIDHAHHDNYGKKALEETAEFDNAVKRVTELTTTEDTLTIVTADHSHVFSLAGYPSRGHNILGTVDGVPESEKPNDGMPYLTLNYANGPFSGRYNYTDEDTTGNDFQQPGCIQMPYETHGGEDVAIYAQGPMAHLFHTTHEQSYIAHVLMYSACIGDYKDNCDKAKREKVQSALCGVSRPMSSLLVVVVLLGVMLLERGLL